MGKVQQKTLVSEPSLKGDILQMNNLHNQRYLSLDVFRGATIFLMIIVNSPGKGAEMYPFLVHASWFGFTLADLVFPSFLFAMGNAMAFSIKKFDGRNDSQFLKKVIKRTFVIFLLGYLMYWFPFFRSTAEDGLKLIPFGETRIMGVLQRIALCYFFAALLIRYLSVKSTILISLGILFVYWLVLYVFGENGQELTMTGNAVKKLDLLILGEGHIYKKDAIPFDPEGLLSTLPSIVNVLAGYWIGLLIRQNKSLHEKLVEIMIPGLLLVTIGLWWNMFFPFSKKLWTSSFVVYVIGIDILALSFLIYLIELRKWKYGLGFFTVFGKNPLFIYLLSELLLEVLKMVKLYSGTSIFEWVSIFVFQRVFPGSFGAFATAVWFMLICWAAGYILDRKRIYIKI